jgi:hypothetical protein
LSRLFDFVVYQNSGSIGAAGIGGDPAWRMLRDWTSDRCNRRQSLRYTGPPNLTAIAISLLQLQHIRISGSLSNANQSQISGSRHVQPPYP